MHIEIDIDAIRKDELKRAIEYGVKRYLEGTDTDTDIDIDTDVPEVFALPVVYPIIYGNGVMYAFYVRLNLRLKEYDLAKKVWFNYKLKFKQSYDSPQNFYRDSIKIDYILEDYLDGVDEGFDSESDLETYLNTLYKLYNVKREIIESIISSDALDLFKEYSRCTISLAWEYRKWILSKQTYYESSLFTDDPEYKVIIDALKISNNHRDTKFLRIFEDLRVK